MPGLPSPSSDSTALVTGASSGIGADIARELARRGHGVTLVARRRDRLQELADELQADHGVAAQVVPCDLTDPEARAALPAQVGRHVSILVNNAGFGTSGEFVESPLEQELQQIRLLCEAVADLTHRFAGPMAERGEGAILTVASTAGFQPLPRMAGYGAAKAWARSFSQAMHLELGPRGIAVTTLSPGPVRTEFFEKAGPTPIERVIPRPLWVDAASTARAAIDGLARNRVEVVPGRGMSALITAGRLTPAELMRPALQRFFR